MPQTHAFRPFSTSGTVVRPTIGLHPAARHKTAAASRGDTLVRVAGSISSAMTLTVALRKYSASSRKYVHLNQCISDSAAFGSVHWDRLKNTVSYDVSYLASLNTIL